MADLPRAFQTASSETGSGGSGSVNCVGVVDSAIEGVGRVASLAALFPHITFEPLGPAWPDRPPPQIDVLLVAVTGSSSEDVEAAVRRLKVKRPGLHVVIALRDADVTTTRRLMREGAADVLTAPVGEPALALSLERLLAAGGAPAEPKSKSGEVVAVLKAGGGVGATTLAVQVAALIAQRGVGGVCLADLDLQFGSAGLYLDLPEAVTIADCLSSGSLADTPFAAALATHRTGARLLAAPREMVALETLGPAEVTALITGLRRDFRLTIVDLPSVWTAWTNQLLNLADRIVLVTHLSVPHVQMVKRQLRVLASQRLEDRPLILVCNNLSPDQSASVSIKAAERALERTFDVVIPEDRKIMNAAINQGVELSAVRRGTKLEKAVGELADKVAATAPVAAAPRRWR
jgi:pilus assembly protein CpaE